MDFPSAVGSVSLTSPQKTETFKAPNDPGFSKASVSFEALLPRVDNQTNVQAGVPSKQDKAVQELASVIAEQFIGELIKEQMDFGGGNGMQADFHKTVFVKAVAEQLAESDALGIREYLENSLGEN
ncbi:MAG: hypothetical protein AAF478_12730 [Pseudomonadota bacterium]